MPQAIINRPVDIIIPVPYKLHLPSHITPARLADGFGPLSSPSYLRIHPWITSNPIMVSPHHMGFGDLEN